MHASNIPWYELVAAHGCDHAESVTQSSYICKDAKTSKEIHPTVLQPGCEATTFLPFSCLVVWYAALVSVW